MKHTNNIGLEHLAPVPVAPLKGHSGTNDQYGNTFYFYIIYFYVHKGMSVFYLSFGETTGFLLNV